ncbi:MAG: MarR family winged helix-turn-helix transcriptional regulator [Actinomycetota bacterium]|nr:MarR family winged helix-turn-helix transcriptional regulator [Actinomycetota bacterium]MEC9467728.1 MarR family winged helix-turn-helix transcriptional regulator [Actinomycetota bacterium]MED6327847.1 MarR family winged helix-turn-helix transcriptional regulator [Actinomycetota bacterium]
MDVATLGLLLTRLGRLNEHFLAEHHRRHDTTSAEAAVLLLLANAPEEAVNPSVIAERIVQTSGGLTATLKRLQARGLVERRPDPCDGRGRLVALTAAGRAAHDTVFADLVDRYRLVFADVDDGAALVAVRDLMRGFERFTGATSSAWWTHDQDHVQEGVR